eukprot:g461.t1
MNYTAPTPQYQDHECHYGDQSEPTPAMDDCSGEKHPQESFQYDPAFPALDSQDEHIAHSSDPLVDTPDEALPSEACANQDGEDRALLSGGLAATTDLILKSFASNLENIIGFANEKLDDEVAALSSEINDATIYVDHCTQHTHDKAKAFKQQLCASIGVFGLLGQTESSCNDGAPTSK